MISKRAQNLSKSNCNHLGTILKTHGVKGDLLIKITNSNWKKNPESVFIEIDNCLVPFFITQGSIKETNQDSIIIRLDTILSKFDAIKLCGYDVFLPKAEFKKSRQTNSLENIVGFIVTDIKHGKLGTITKFVDIQGNPLLQLDSKDILLPINGIEIIQIDEQNMILTINTPEGLLEVFTK